MAYAALKVKGRVECSLKSSRELHVVDFENNNKRYPHKCVVWTVICEQNIK